MFRAVEEKQDKVDIAGPLNVERRIPAREYFIQILDGIGIAAGMALLWVMELARNGYFGTLDRLNVKPRKRRRASAFPPGVPRHHHDT